MSAPPLQHSFMFDFGAPVGFRIATRHPERVEGLVLLNGNAYEVGLGPGMHALEPYWKDRAANEAAIRGFLTLDATRSQYVDGVADPASVNPDLCELDQRYMELPGRDQVMPDSLYDYQNNVTLYPTWQEYLRTYRLPVLLPWGSHDAFFPPAAARAYLKDLPDAELHMLDTGHFATATRSAKIAQLICAFLKSHVVTRAAAPSVQATARIGMSNVNVSLDLPRAYRAAAARVAPARGASYASTRRSVRS